MAFADSDKLKQIIHENHYIVTDKINSQDYGMFTNGIEQAIEKATVDDVEKVVRCKNCKHFITDTFKRTMCNRTFTMFEMNENDFCSYGEKKEGAEK